MPVLDVDTTADYQELRFDPTQTASITVANGMVLVGVAVAYDENLRNPAWLPDDLRLIPGVWGFDSNDFNGRRIAGLRVKYLAPPSTPVPHVYINVT